MTATRDAGYLAATRPLVERTIGRPLRLHERVVDVFALTRALDDAKDACHRAIVREQARAVRSAIRTGHPIRLETTRGILKPLDALYSLGRAEARAELERAGYLPARALEGVEPLHPALGDVGAKIQSGLNGFSVRLQLEKDRLAVALQTSHEGAIGDAMAKALVEVMGARSIAAGVVSTALFNGLGATFEENSDLVGGWSYSSVLDGGTCPVCESADGTEYASWADVQDDLPNGGPNPQCDGGDRCRCRAVPLGASAAPTATPEIPLLVEPLAEPSLAAGDILSFKGATRGTLVDRSQKIEGALADITQLVHLPDRANVLADGVKVTMRRNTTSRGHLKFGTVQRGGVRVSGVPLEINISSDAHAAVTFAHEYGHLIDLSYLGKTGGMATSNISAVEGAVGDALRVLDEAWQASETYQALAKQSSDRLGRYMLSRNELWARSFAQWAAERHELGTLRAQMREMVEAEATKVAELGHVPGWRFYPETWQAHDFTAISDAIEGVLRAAGLLQE